MSLRRAAWCQARQLASSSVVTRRGASADGGVAVADDPDLVDGVELAMVDPGAGASGSFPSGVGLKVFMPERPGTTLLGAHGVDAAQCFASGVALEEDAVVAVRGLVLVERPLVVDLVCVLAVECIGRDVQVCRDLVGFLWGKPDVSGWPCAAVAALGAGEAQTLCVPRLGRCIGLVRCGGHVRNKLAVEAVRFNVGACYAFVSSGPTQKWGLCATSHR